MPISLDLSGGYIETHYGNGADEAHLQRVHIQPFDATTLVFSLNSTTAPVDVPSWLTEFQAALIQLLSPTHSISSYDLYQVVAGEPVFNQTFGPASGSNVGTNPTASQSKANQLTLNWRTAGNKSAKWIILGSGNYPNQRLTAPTGPVWDAARTLWLTPTGSGVPFHESRIVGHDGTPIRALRSVTSTLNRRLRRHFKLA